MNLRHMLAPISRGASESLLAFLLMALLVLVVLDQANPLTTRLGRDSGIFLFVSSYLLEGETLYVHAWENKPPLLFFINALGLWIGKGTRWGVWGLEFMFLLGAALAGFRVLKTEFGTGPAALASITWLGGLNLVLAGGNFTEEYSLFFCFASLYLFSVAVEREAAGWPHFWMGVSLGINFLIRPNNTGVQLAILVTGMVRALAQRTSRMLWRQLALTGIGFMIPAMLVCGYFLARGGFDLFLEASFIYNFSYGGHLNPLGALVSGINNLGFAAGVGLLGVGHALDRLIRSGRAREISPFTLWICIDFVLELILTGLSGRNYEHYFITWLPFIALSSGLLTRTVFEAVSQVLQRHASLFVASLLALITLMQSSVLSGYWDTFSSLVRDRSRVERIDIVAEYVNASTSSDETVLVWGGQPGINFQAERDAPSRYLLYPYYVPSAYTDRLALEFYRVVTHDPPALILDGSYFVPEEVVPLSERNPRDWLAERGIYAAPHLEDFLRFFRQNYQYESTVTRVDVYRLKR